MESFKKDLFAQFAIIGKSLSNGNRLEILEFLAQGERTVDSLANAANLSIANTSQHLQELKRSGLVTSRSEAQKSYYRLNDYSVVELLVLMRKIAENNLSDIHRLVSTYLVDKDNLEPIRRAELLKRVKKGDVTVVDVRPFEEYTAGHVPLAINIPLNELEQNFSTLPKSKEVIAYCRGPYCVLAFEAIAQLRSKGFKARRMEDGFPEWKLSSLPIE